MPESTPTSHAYSMFLDLAKALADNFMANANLGGKPGSQTIVVLGSSASDIPNMPSWTHELKQKILDRVGTIFLSQETFLEEICRVFGGELGHHLWSRAGMRDAILESLRVEQISNVACQMLGHADVVVRQLISEEYKALADSEMGPPPHLTYELLAHLAKHGFVNHIVTMNFDEMLDTALENELGRAGFDRIITGHEPIVRSEPGRPRLFKVHGTASSPESLRFTYTEVAVLTSSQAKHLNALLSEVSEQGCECLNLVSFGYSWQDSDLAHWVLAHRERFNTIFIVRREDKLPEIFDKYFKARNTAEAKRFKVLPINDLCGGRREYLASSTFWWALVEAVWDRLPGQALIPFARHLLLGKILEEPGRRGPQTPLARRVRLEILLHLLKSKGMINTFGAPDSPRILTYFSRLRSALEGHVTVDNFLNTLNLAQFMSRSPEPEARDTFFSNAGSAAELIEDVSGDLAQASPETVVQPHFENGLLVERVVDSASFITAQVEQIVRAPEIEIAREVDARLYWIFSSLMPIRTFPQFVHAVDASLSWDWTHLLAIVESKTWMTYPWSQETLSRAKGRKVFLILPSMQGLDAWKVGREIRSIRPDAARGAECLELEIPWWRHNRHLFLPVRLDGRKSSLGPGVFYIRQYKSPVVSPVFLKEARDQAKLLATFLYYCLRSSSFSSSEFASQLCPVVGELMKNEGVHVEMRKLVARALEALGTGSNTLSE